MNPIKRDAIVSKLLKLWPKGWTDDQLKVFCQRLDDFETSEVLAAMETHFGQSKFRPKAVEIVEIIRLSKAPSEAAKYAPTDRPQEFTFAQILRIQQPALASECDAYVLWCYCRGLWRKYRADINGRLKGKGAAWHNAQKANDARWRCELHSLFVGGGYGVEDADNISTWINTERGDAGLSETVAYLRSNAMQKQAEVVAAEIEQQLAQQIVESV